VTDEDGTERVNAPSLVLVPADSPAGLTVVKVTEQVVELPGLTVVGLQDVPLPDVKATLPEKLPFALLFGFTVTVKGAVESMVGWVGCVTLR